MRCSLLVVLFFCAFPGRLLWAQTYDTTTVTIRTGCFPQVVFPGETFAFRFDYLAGSAVDTVYIPQDFDWSPLEVVGYRYIRAVEDGSRSLQVILRMPDTPDAWNRNINIFKSPPIRWRLHDGKEKEEEKYCYVFVQTKYIYYTSPDGGSVYEDRSAGSWHLINRGVRDNTVLPIARGAGYLIFGLDTRLVNLSFNFAFPWEKEKQTFKVWVEGPLLLYHVDPSMDSTDFGFVPWQYSYFSEEKYFRFNLVADTFKTNLVPYHAPYVPRNLENSWRLFVLPRPEAQNGSRGKIVAAFYHGPVELFRRELNFYVYGDILKNNIILTPVYKDTTLSGDWYTVGCVGYNSNYSDVCREIFFKNWYTYSYLNSGNLYINYKYDQDGFLTIKSSSSFQYDRSAILNYTTYFQSLNEKIQYYLESLRRASPCDPFYEVVKCESQGNSTVAVYRFSGDLKTETHRENFYAVFKQSAKVAFELGDIPPEDPYRDRIPPVQYSLATSYFLGQLNYNAEFTGIPGFTIECRYPQQGQGTCALGEIINDFEPVYRQRTVKSGDYGFETYDDRDIIFWHGYGDIFGKKGQLFNWPSDLSEPPEDTSSTQPIEIRLLANPSVQRLQDLAGSLNDRRPFEFIVQVYQNGQPLANTPLTVEGPFADDEIPSTDALLLLNEPQQTNAFGIYSFFWIPPSKNWFEGKSMPYGFRFRVRVGDTWENATVQVANLIIQGQLVQRHAGAKLRQDPDRDGLLPLVGVEVSLEPDFPPDRTVRTDDNGHFELGVPEAGSYRVYARRREFWPDNFPKWSRTQGRVFVTESGPVPDTLLLFLAELPVGSMLQKWIPEITFDMESVRDSLQHLRVIPEIVGFLTEIARQDSTGALDEEAVRRLQQAVFATYDLFQGAHDLADCGKTAIWEGSLGILFEVVKLIVEKIKLLEKISQSIRSKLPADWKQSSDPKIRQLGRTLEALEGIKIRLVNILERIQAWAQKSSNDLLESMRHAIINGDFASFNTMYFLRERIFEPLAELITRVTDLAKKTKLDDFSREFVFSQAMEQSGLNRLLNSLSDTIKEILLRGQLDDLRAVVATTLQEEVELARQRQFPAYPLSFYHARRASNGWLELMRQERTRLLGRCEGLLGLNEMANAAMDAIKAAMLGLSVATSGALTPAAVAVDRISTAVGLVLKAAMILTGLEVMSAIHPEGNYGRPGIAAVRQAFSLKAPALAVRVHSPVRLMVVDTQGRRTGADATGQFYNEIPGAGYWPASDSLEETILLPADIGPFRVIVHGSGSGTYALELLQLDSLGEETVLRRWTGEVSPLDRWQLVVESPVEAAASATLQSLPEATDLFVMLAGQRQDSVQVGLGLSVTLEAVATYGDTTLTLPATNVQWSVSDTIAAVMATERPGQASVVGLHPGRTTLTVQAEAFTRRIVLDVTGLEGAISLSRQSLTAGDTVSVQVRVQAHGVALPEQFAVEVRPPVTRYWLPVMPDENGLATVIWRVPDSLSGYSGPGQMALVGVVEGDTISLAQAPFALVASAVELPEVLEAEATEDGVVVARLQLSRSLLAEALQPELLLSVADSLPAALPSGFAAIGPAIGWSFWDQAQAMAVTPTSAYRMQLWSGAYQGRPKALYWDGTAWEALEVEAASGFWEATLESAGGLILLARPEQVVAVEKAALPEQVRLEVYPNPFGGRVQIRVGIPRSGLIRMTLYDVLGREVARLYEGEQTAGWHTQGWDAPELASGLYLLVLEGEGFRTTKTMVKVH